jgi:hypothetical protein
MFADFSERTVEIKHCGKIFTVSKLSILQYSRIIEIISSADAYLRDNDSDKPIRNIISEACEELWKILESILPAGILRDRYLFKYNDLVELCMHIAFGSYLDRKSAGRGKYYESAQHPDYQLKAARILSRFGGYTLETLLDEPASIFFALAEYAERITADNALEFVAAGIKAAFDSADQLLAKRGSLTVSNPDCTQADFSVERKMEMEEFLKNYQADRKKE